MLVYYFVSAPLLLYIRLTWHFSQRSRTIPDRPVTIAVQDEALDYFIGTYKDMATTVALPIIKDRRLAGETVQEALMAAWKIVPSFTDRSSFRAALYRIVMKEACIRLNRNRYGKYYLDRNLDEDIWVEKAFLSLKKSEQRTFIGEALKKIPPHDPLMLSLFHLQEKGNCSFIPIHYYHKKRAGNTVVPASFVTM